MSDPIIDIIREAWSITGDDMYFDENLAKQIRQQIGREILREQCPDSDWKVNREWLANRIREVCQLEES